MTLISDNRAEYAAWVNARERCFNSNHPGFYRYGGRGITMCERWASSFANFLTDMGNRPTNHHSIDRIDNDGPYAPDNCRWATPEQQRNNRNEPGRKLKLYEVNGELKTAPEWADILGTTPDAFKQKWRRRRQRSQPE